MHLRTRFGRRVLIEALDSRTLLSAGALDTSFSDDGKAFLSNDFTANDVAVQADGKTVVVGVCKTPLVPLPDETRFAIARFNVDGTPDTTFGSGGIVRTQMSDDLLHPPAFHSFANAVAIAPDGRIVVVGGAERTDNLSFRTQAAIAVYQPDGTPDSSFDDDGRRIFDLADNRVAASTEAHDVAIQPDGKIVFVGATSRGGDDDYFVIRLFPNGALDQDDFNPFNLHLGFGDGVQIIPLGGEDTAQAVKIDGNGDVVVAGTSYRPGVEGHVALVRFNTFGQFVSTFDGDGKLSFGVPGSSLTSVSDLLLQSGGRAVIAGDASRANGTRDFFVARFTAAGQLDTTFGGVSATGYSLANLVGNARVGGITPAPVGTGNGFLVSGSSGSAAAGAGFTVIKYTEDGLLDGTFGLSGKANFDFGSVPAHIARGPGRRFMLVGGPQFTTARVLDVGANVVHATPLFDPSGGELGSNPASFFVFREERLPVATRVFFSIGGTATRPGFLFTTPDYTVSPMSTSPFVNGTYVDIPANQTYVVVTLTPIDDTFVEGTETAVFTILPSTSYDVGTPSVAELTIVDNDFLFNNNINRVGTGTLTPSAADLPASGKVTYTLGWTHPDVWRDLNTIEFRIVDQGIAIGWIRWNETTNTLSLRDPRTGLFSQSGQPGSRKRFSAGGVELDLHHSTVVGSGPTGKSVTLTLALRLNAKKPRGSSQPLVYRLEAFASDDQGNKQGFDEIGTLTLR